MEDYSVFDEMRDIKSIVMIVDCNNEDFNKKIIEEFLNVEFMPLRFSYDLTKYSKEYIDLTKNLFTYYYEYNNSYQNELLRIKKHFKHYQREPLLIFIPEDKKYDTLKQIFSEIGIKIIDNANDFIETLRYINDYSFDIATKLTSNDIHNIIDKINNNS